MNMQKQIVTLKSQVKELKRTCSLLSKYADAYTNAVRKDCEPSDRIYKWIDFYNESRDTVAWEIYCKEMGFSLKHDAYDCFA